MNDPVVVYNAATNIEAFQICEMLNGEGIDAHAVEDTSRVGVWLGNCRGPIDSSHAIS